MARKKNRSLFAAPAYILWGRQLPLEITFERLKTELPEPYKTRVELLQQQYEKEKQVAQWQAGNVSGTVGGIPSLLGAIIGGQMGSYLGSTLERQAAKGGWEAISHPILRRLTPIKKLVTKGKIPEAKLALQVGSSLGLTLAAIPLSVWLKNVIVRASTYGRIKKINEKYQRELEKLWPSIILSTTKNF